MNPSLTLAACALRTADAILDVERQMQPDQAQQRGPTTDRVIVTDVARVP